MKYEIDEQALIKVINSTKSLAQLTGVLDVLLASESKDDA